MSEEVPVVIVGPAPSPGGGKKTSVVIVISGSTTRACLEELRAALTQLAKKCGLSVSKFTIKAKRKKKKKKM